jgi:Zn-dependent protease with chaperone function
MKKSINFQILLVLALSSISPVFSDPQITDTAFAKLSTSGGETSIDQKLNNPEKTHSNCLEFVVKKKHPLTVLDVETIVNDLYSKTQLQHKPSCSISIYSDSDPKAYDTLCSAEYIKIGNGLLSILSYEELEAMIAHDFGTIVNKNVEKKKDFLLSPINRLAFDIDVLKCFKYKKLTELKFALFSDPLAVQRFYLLKKERDLAYEADELAVQITNNPKALMSALEKLSPIEEKEMAEFPVEDLMPLEVCSYYPKNKSRIARLEIIAAEQASKTKVNNPETAQKSYICSKNVVRKLPLTVLDVETIVNDLYSKTQLQHKPSCSISIYSDSDPKAYEAASGEQSIIIGNGLLSIFSYEELKGVVAHELGHIVHEHIKQKNVDIMLSLINMLAKKHITKNILIEATQKVAGVSSNPFIVRHLYSLKKARDHEYEADEFAAQITNNPKACASFLKKLKLLQDSITHLFESEDCSTHPKTENRISSLEIMAAEQASKNEMMA